MRKFFFTILSTLLFVGTASVLSAQTFHVLRGKANPAIGFPLTATSLKDVLPFGSTDNKLSTKQALPFPFVFFGDTMTEYLVSDNGYITFDTTQKTSFTGGSFLPAALSNAPRKAIFAFWTDFEFTLNATYPNGTPAQSRVVSFTEGTSPNRKHVIQYRLMIPKGRTATQNQYFVSVVLMENGDFYVTHNDAAFPTNGAVSGVVGVQKDFADGADFNDGLFQYVTNQAYSFVKGPQAEYDLRAVSLTALNYAEKDKNVSYVLTFQNFGSKALTSIKVNHTTDGAVVSNTVSPTTAITGSGGIAQLTVNNATFTTTGKKTLKVWISEPNGETDTAKLETHADDTLSRNIYIAPTLAPRRVLVEEFTSATCGPCAAVNPAFNKLLQGYNPIVSIVKYQCYIPVQGDPMYAYAKTYVDRRAQYYGINSAPSSRVDGLNTAHPGNLVNAPTFISTRQSTVGAGMVISATPSNTGDDWNFDVKVKSLIDFDTAGVGPLLLHAAVIQNEINYNSAPGTNGEKKFEQVLREMLPDANGTALNKMSLNEERTVKLSYTVDKANFTSADLRLVVWVQVARTGDVLNSYMSSLDFSVGIDENEANTIKGSIFPNPTSGLTNIKFNLEKAGKVSINVSDMTGKVMSNVVSNTTYAAGENNQVSYDASVLPKGIYFVNINVDGQTSTQKLIVE